MSKDVQQLKSNPRVTFRRADQDDLIAFYGKHPSYSIRALVFFLDGVLAAIGGWKIEGHSYVVFSEIKEGVKVEKSTIFRCAKEILSMVSEKKCPMYAATTNGKFLEKLGFELLDTPTDSKEFYVWQC